MMIGTEITLEIETGDAKSIKIGACVEREIGTEIEREIEKENEKESEIGAVIGMIDVAGLEENRARALLATNRMQ